VIAVDRRAADREDARLIQQQCCDELRDQRRAEHHLQVQNEKLAGDLVTAQSQMNRTEAGALRMKSVVARLSDDVLAEQAECQKLRQNISLLDVELRKHHAEVVEARNVQKAVETELHQVLARGGVCSAWWVAVQSIWVGAVPPFRN